MTTVGVLPESSQAPLGWLYLAIGIAVGVLLVWATAPKRSSERQPV
jgi:DHA1 family bicyclomycin/chloramphenicol resistance-like MFS transporter